MTYPPISDKPREHHVYVRKSGGERMNFGQVIEVWLATSGGARNGAIRVWRQPVTAFNTPQKAVERAEAFALTVAKQIGATRLTGVSQAIANEWALHQWANELTNRK